MTTRRVLVVEDSEPSRVLVRHLLEPAGFDVVEAVSGREAMERFEAVDLVLLDVRLPDIDGFEILRRMRATSDVPVVLVTGEEAEVHRVGGLNLGADDYVVKPFAPDELVARVHAVLRRSQPKKAPTTLVFPGLAIDVARREVVMDGRSLRLPNKEFDLLVYLASRPGKVCSREELLGAVWRSRSDWQDPKTVTEHVRRIRRQIEPDPDNPVWILTERGVGYRFRPPS